MVEKKELLLLHGALGSKVQFETLKEELNQHFKIYDLNFEGHGGDVSEKEFSIELFTDNVVDFLQKEKLDKVNIFGYSMGGYVALNLAFNFPEKVDQITTLGTKFNWSSEIAAAEVRLLNPLVIEKKVPHFAHKLEVEHAPTDWKDLMSKTARMMLGMGEGQRLREKAFEKINHSIKIGIGDRDQMVSTKESEKIVSLLPNADLVILKGVQHNIEKIDPEILTNYIYTSFF